VRLQEEAKILVASEDDPNRQLLETRISKDDGYQKQQGRPAITRRLDVG
jgi:protein phosphatase-4 regulatory subunit 3